MTLTTLLLFLLSAWIGFSAAKWLRHSFAHPAAVRGIASGSTHKISSQSDRSRRPAHRRGLNSSYQQSTRRRNFGHDTEGRTRHASPGPSTAVLPVRCHRAVAPILAPDPMPDTDHRLDCPRTDLRPDQRNRPARSHPSRLALALSRSGRQRMRDQSADDSAQRTECRPRIFHGKLRRGEPA